MHQRKYVYLDSDLPADTKLHRLSKGEQVLQMKEI